MKSEKPYEINGKNYTQRPLVLGQIMPLIDLMQGIELRDFSATGLIQSLGPNLPEVMAIVLIPEGTRLSQKDIPTLAEEFEEYLSIETALEVVEDFLSFNPVSSISARMTGVMIKMIEAATAVLSSMTSKGLSRTSAMETSPDEDGSSGTLPSLTH